MTTDRFREMAAGLVASCRTGTDAEMARLVAYALASARLEGWHAGMKEAEGIVDSELSDDAADRCAKIIRERIAAREGVTMVNVKDGGPAFPTGTYHSGGMSLRDYFAANALMAVAASERAICSDCGDAIDEDSMADMARMAYQIADAMLAARENGSPDAR